MKLSADKRNKLILVALGTLVLCGVVWYYLIGALNRNIADFKDKQATAEEQRKKIDTATKNAAKLEKDLAAANEKLNAINEEMASGDLYSWMYTTIKTFARSYRVDIPQFSTIEAAANNLIPGFPYRQVKITIAGDGFFHDIGRFVADFENRFPHIRVENLNLEPATGSDRTAEREKLSFRMDIIALVNNTTPSAANITVDSNK